VVVHAAAVRFPEAIALPEPTTIARSHQVYEQVFRQPMAPWSKISGGRQALS
jgi:hypothetical protein